MSPRRSSNAGANQQQNTRNEPRSRYMSVVLRYIARNNDLQAAKEFAASAAQAFKDLKGKEGFHSLKFIGQLERGARDGLFHVQMFIYHKDRQRHNTFRTKLYDHLMDYFPQWPALAQAITGRPSPQIIGISPSDARRADALKSYCMKDDTAVPGTQFHWDTARYQGEDLVPITANPLTWQRKLLEILDQPPHGRHIYWIYDRLGKSGKSMLHKYILWQGQTTSAYGAVPLSHGSAQQLCGAALAAMEGSPKPITKWLIDMPRSKCTKNSDSSMYNFIESLKNGVLTCAMYAKYQQRIFRTPHVIVFSNSLPQLSAMTGDRWMVYQLQRRTGPRGPFQASQPTVGDITDDIDMVRLAQEDIIRMSQAQRVTPPAQVAPPPPRSYPNSDGITSHYNYPAAESQEQVVNCTPAYMVPETDSETDDFAAADDSDDLPSEDEYGYEYYERSPKRRKVDA